MTMEDIKGTLERHLKLLEGAAQNNSSGEELKAITEAIVDTVTLLVSYL